MSETSFFVERMGIERSIAQEIGGTLEEPFAPYPYDCGNSSRFWSGIKTAFPAARPSTRGFPDESCAKIEKWIRNGPCIGIKYLGSSIKG
jgi:hypothetical protein